MNFYVGVDGGGTKTAVLCMNERGETTARAIFGPFNITSVGREGLRRVMDEILGFICAQGNCLRLCIGAAGAGSAALGREVAAVMADYPNIPYELVGDYEVARCGALGGRPGVALVAGTGSVCSGVNAAGETFRVGGWGHLIGDGGSGYALGRDALRELTLSLDGMAEKGLLCRLLEEEFSLTSRAAIVERAYGMDKSATAALAACVLRAADEGDTAARRILRDNARELAALVRATALPLGLTAPDTALLGGLMKSGSSYRRAVTEEISRALPGARCVEPAFGPDMGAALMAREGARHG